MAHANPFAMIASVWLAMLAVGLPSANAFENETTGQGTADHCIRENIGVETDDGILRVSPTSMRPPSEAATKVSHRVRAVPQDGWPISNGSGNEAGFTGSPTYTDLDRDGDLEILVGSRDAKVYAWHHDGTTVSGWPFTTGSYVVGSVVVGNIDGDRYPEVVFNSNDGHLYAVTHDGMIMSGWPKLIDIQTPHSGGAVWQGSPTLADIDRNGSLDIVYNSTDHGATYVLNSQGQDLAGWPQQWDDVEFNAYAPAVGDLDGDGSLEVVAGTMYSEGAAVNWNKLYAWHSNGMPVAGWPVILDDDQWSAIKAVVLADIDGDHNLDVLAVDNTSVYVLHADGTAHAGWPYEGASSESVQRRIAIANLDEDEQLEVVADYLYDMLILDDDGTPMSSYATSQVNPGHPTIADVDNDGRNEIVTVGVYPDDSLYAWNEDGSLVGGFPLVVEGRVNSTPMIVDIDGDADLEIAVGEYGQDATELHFFVWDLDSLENPNLKEWPMYQHDQQNTGRYIPPLFADGFETGDTSAWSAAVP